MLQIGRDFDERKALLRGLINALIRNLTIETTEAKADAIKGLVDKLITQAKKANLHATRLIESFLIDQDNVGKLIKEIAPSLKERTSGYLKITKLGRRKGDNAMIVKVGFSNKIEKAAKPAPIPLATKASEPKKSQVKQPVKKTKKLAKPSRQGRPSKSK